MFDRFASATSRLVGHPVTFAVACAIVVGWALTGPFLAFSDTWQLVINTATTISTGLIVFLVQNTQNRHEDALQKKIDELIRATDKARNEFIGLEHQDNPAAAEPPEDHH